MKYIYGLCFISLFIIYLIVQSNSGSNSGSEPHSDHSDHSEPEKKCESNEHLEKGVCVCNKGLVKYNNVCQKDPCWHDKHFENDKCVCNINSDIVDGDICVCYDDYVRDNDYLCTWKKVISYQDLQDFRISNQIVAFTKDGIYIDSKKILNGKLSGFDVLGNHIITGDLSGNIYESTNLKDFTVSKIKPVYNIEFYLNQFPICIMNDEKDTIIYKKNKNWDLISTPSISFGSPICFKDYLQCAIVLDKLYVSTDYIKWTGFSLPDKIDIYYKKPLDIIENTIYLCIGNVVYYTDYRKIEWKKMDLPTYYYWIGIYSNPNDTSMFIIYTIDQLFLTKDGGKTFNQLLGKVVGDRYFNLTKTTIVFSSDKIYFSINDTIYEKQV